jgi:hypothetical protein
VAARRLRIRSKQLMRKGVSPDQGASLAAQKMQLDVQDSLHQAMQQLAQATAQEDYPTAATIRDEACAWLEGGAAAAGAIDRLDFFRSPFGGGELWIGMAIA